ncbi:MAG: peptidylprolyl isomerase [Treponemataceae bacterium]
MKFKQNVCIFIFAALIISMGGCSGMSDNLKSIEGKEGVFAIIETSSGDIVLQLYYDKTPLTVTNFVGLAEGTLDAAKGKPFYNGLKFHRVIKDFMIQGGDPLGNGTGGPGHNFADEFVEGLTFDRPGLLAMANSGPNTNGSQFFITHVPTTWLNYKHTIFGEVIKGQDVVDSVKQGDKIKKVTIVRQGESAKNFTTSQADFDKLNAEFASKQKAEYEKAVEEAKNFYANIAKKVKFEIMKEGKGEKVGLPREVSVHYKGYLKDGSIFDSSEGKDTLDFVTGAGQMITGFDAMVQDMKVGEKRKITLPPETAYGEKGAGKVIPPNATIIFEVELVKVN